MAAPAPGCASRSFGLIIHQRTALLIEPEHQPYYILPASIRRERSL
ncbi:MAG TPA: hypothetical protein VH540_16320 [Ktedonobacterales bacterium]